MSVRFFVSYYCVLLCTTSTRIKPPLFSSTTLLLARIKELEGLLATLRARQVGVLSRCGFTENLTVGSRGNDVACLQRYLTITGDFTHPEGPTSYFGPVTKSAVLSWQMKEGVTPATGFFGPLSRARYLEVVRQ